MRDGLVSVITPAYNCAQFIGKTIESVQAQTYDNWEMVIVDDCSTDNTREVVESYSKDDSRVRYICLKENSGAAVARTESMKAAEGEYMAFWIAMTCGNLKSWINSWLSCASIAAFFHALLMNK